SMVEENEIRAGLSPFERGRIAVIAAQAGAFVNTEDAVSQLFAAASKAKRSKLRSFAEIYEMLGDVLQHPEALSERRGLRLAGALRQGGESRLRDALSAASSRTAEREWAALETVVAELEAGSKNRARRRRPGSVPVAGWRSNDTLHLSSGVTLQRGHDSKGYVIRISGRGATADMVESAMEELRSLFEA
ncbi:MAG: chromosome partitioning protein ParB, partial [Alphaproteobacteria bacterium]|nr:chromosome partitioning protein ParB [Alphaproteobacteria bacterium]